MIVAYDAYVYACCCMVVGCGLLVMPIVVLAIATVIDELIKIYGRKKK